MIKLKSCKSDAQQMTVVAVDDRGREASASISTRTCGGPFLQHDAAVASLVTDLLDAVSALDAVPEAEAVAVVEGAGTAVESAVQAPRKGKTLPPKGAA